jgi:glucan phosphorylase
VRIVKEAIRTVTPRFSARRMVKQYVEEMYAPGAEIPAALAPPSG